MFPQSQADYHCQEYVICLYVCMYIRMYNVLLSDQDFAMSFFQIHHPWWLPCGNSILS